MAAGPIVISILANASQATATLNSTATTASRVGSSFRSMAAPAGIAFAAIAAGAKASITAASDLAESVSKAGQIFGPQTAEIQKFANGAATALGQSKQQALEAASTFGIIAQSAGLSGTSAAGFSKQFTTLASDLASFNNTSPEEAITAIGAAMRGESEPIRKYGVLLDDATLRARAVKLGLIDSVKQGLTPQQKALAASKEILAQTSKAQGDFGRTSQGAANQARIQAAQSENLKAKLGAGLLPAYIKLQQTGIAAIGWMSKHSTTVKIVAGVLAALAAVILIVNVAMAAFNFVLLANPIVLIVAAIIVVIAALALFFTKTETGRAIVTAAWAGIKAAFVTVGAVIGKVIGAIVGFIGKLVTFVVSAVKAYISAWAKIFSVMAQVVAVVVKAVANVIRAIGEIAGKVTKAVASFGKLLVKAGKAIIQGLIDGIRAMFGKLGTTLSDLTSWIKSHKGPPERDAVLLRPAGQAIIDGLISGIEQRKTALARQLAGVTDTIERGITPAIGVIDTARPGEWLNVAGARASINYNIDVKLDSRMTEAEMGAAYDKAIRAARRQGLVR